MAGKLEQAQDSDDAEEFKDIGILDVRDKLLEEEICVEADCGHKVDNIHGRVEKITAVGTAEESETWEGVS